MDYRHSLAGRLFKWVFSAYLVLAILVTIAQLVIEYSSIQRLIGSDLASLGQSFSGGITGAMWELDRPLLTTMARGIAQSSIVTGVKITSSDGETFAAVGMVPVSASVTSNHIFTPFQFNRSRLLKQTPTGVREIGQLTIFSDRSVALARIKYSFIVILINSIVKTVGLWIIFYLVITRGLSRPLSKMTEAVSQIKFAAESKTSISLEYPYQDELGSLTQSMNKMQERLFAARRELEMVNYHLEEAVAERTERLSEALNFSETVLLSSPLAMGVYTADGQCALANTSYARLFDTSLDGLRATNLHDFESFQTGGLCEQCLTALQQHTPQQIDMQVVTASGKSLWLECRILPTYTNGENHLLIQFIDLTERKLIEEELRHLAFHDPLTRLPNRRLLHDRLMQALRASKRQNSHLAVLFLDLNKFKQLNDTHGHDVGDQVLIEVARRLKQVIRDSDTIARLGGDEFVVVLEGLGAEPEQAADYTASVADKIRDTLRVEYILGSIRYQPSASIGIKLFIGDEGDPDQIVKEADEAMYEAKKAAELERLST
jgi:diguanylate cyclase (GGDEF)-like protein/PAS domain S-box-containing protein